MDESWRQFLHKLNEGLMRRKDILSILHSFFFNFANHENIFGKNLHRLEIDFFELVLVFFDDVFHSFGLGEIFSSLKFQWKCFFIFLFRADQIDQSIVVISWSSLGTLFPFLFFSFFIFVLDNFNIEVIVFQELPCNNASRTKCIALFRPQLINLLGDEFPEAFVGKSGVWIFLQVRLQGLWNRCWD